MIELKVISIVGCDVPGCAESIRIYVGRLGAVKESELDRAAVRRTAAIAHGWGSIPSPDGIDDLCPKHAANRKPYRDDEAAVHHHSRQCYEDPGPGHGHPYLICDRTEGGPDCD